MFSNFMDDRDVGMVERRRGLRFTTEAKSPLLIRRELRLQKLDRHVPVELCVEGLVDVAHPPLADLLEQAVVGDHLARLRHDGGRIAEFFRCVTSIRFRRREEDQHLELFGNGMEAMVYLRLVTKTMLPGRTD